MTSDSTELPPAYEIEAPVIRATTTRSLEDTRRLILANGAVMRRTPKDETTMELIICRVHRIGQPRQWRRAQTGPRQLGQHYAVLVNRGGYGLDSSGIRVIVEGEPRDTVEEALDWLLDRTEIILDEMLARHFHAAQATCCAHNSQVCTNLLRGGS